jgi:hypothetical protein
VRSLVAAPHLEGERAWNRDNAAPGDVVAYYTAMTGLLEDRRPESRHVIALRVAVSEL